MPDYNPDYFKPRLSEKLLKTAKEALDDLGDYKHLKKELDDVVYPDEKKVLPPKEDVEALYKDDNRSSGGVVI
jgi:hypothetical protein